MAGVASNNGMTGTSLIIISGQARVGVNMDIHQVRPGMICHTPDGSGYVLEVDVKNQLILVQREDETIPFQVHLSELLEELD